ncbi:hypothetical protein QMK19_03565 [Streptomyces sp. H10-C2]|uniref:hypothetical protein n=1 Tax=unclassified Streptomyces TaxID=2593676 RepID=UPI0024BA0612|nr:MULTISPECIES: hypothetical protein [unclassified Streptomyces]MDJ0342265.1 hypothetical protein [Streptomyces sp. PH10-H1]MDJ0368779.1 hypothetical protein [Streptomyces sp. H10-C2]
MSGNTWTCPKSGTYQFGLGVDPVFLGAGPLVFTADPAKLFKSAEEWTVWCRRGLDLRDHSEQLARQQRKAEQAAAYAAKQAAHLQRRIDALIRVVRAQHARLVHGV